MPLFCSRIHVDIWSLEDIEISIDFIKMMHVALVLVLCPVGEQSHAHVLDAVLEVLLFAVEFVQHARLLPSRHHSSARGPLIHCNLL